MNNQCNLEITIGDDVIKCARGESISLSMIETTLEFSKDLEKALNERVEFILRNNAVPPVKGDITEGKIKWRGIYLTSEWNGTGRVISVVQRGKRIGEPVVIK